MPTHTLLFVDDEQNVLNSLSRVFRNEDYEIFTATSAKEGLEKVMQNEISLVLSDQRMPEMTGTEFLDEIKKKSPNTIRIILTGYADIDAAMDAINKGEVYRFITKPWDDLELKIIINRALKLYELEKENRELTFLTIKQNDELKDLNKNLEQKVMNRTKEIEDKSNELASVYKELKKNFLDTIKVFVGLLELYNPELGGHSKRVASLSISIAKRYDLDENDMELIETSAMLHDIGFIGVPEDVLDKVSSELTPPEETLVKQHPVVGQSAITFIKNLHQAGILIRSHHEEFDGKGYPDGLKNEEIPLGSRIIAVASTYDELINKNKSSKEDALAYIKKESGYGFDPEVVFNFLDLFNAFEVASKAEVRISLSELKKGMVLSRDLYTGRGRLLLAKNEPIQENHIEKVISFHKIDPIVGKISVYS
ncbi:MAG: response regulator [Desulfobacterales bacterium]|nr:response regulator [Desulfobacterales bacterium]